MPRRKATRSKPKAADTDPNTSIMANGDDVMKQKKEVFMNDFDIQVKSHLDELNVEVERTLSEAKKIFMQAKIGVPKKIRAMTLKDFLAKGGNLATLDMSEVADALDPNISFSDTISNQKNIQHPPPSPLSIGKPSRKRVASAIAEIEPPSETTGKRLTRTRAKKTTAPQPFVTPLQAVRPKRGAANNGLPTITPKFDPKEPITTARKAKHGETLLSMAGSPVVPDNRRPSAVEESLLSLTLNKQSTLLGECNVFSQNKFSL